MSTNTQGMSPAASSVIFPTWARFVLGLLVAFLGCLAASQIVDDDVRAGITSLTLLLASAGVVPPTIRDLPSLSPAARFALTAAVTVIAYIVNVSELDEVLRVVITGVLSVAASLGIVPPQATTARVR